MFYPHSFFSNVLHISAYKLIYPENPPQIILIIITSFFLSATSTSLPHKASLIPSTRYDTCSCSNPMNACLDHSHNFCIFCLACTIINEMIHQTCLALSFSWTADPSSHELHHIQEHSALALVVALQACQLSFQALSNKTASHCQSSVLPIGPIVQFHPLI